MIKQLIVAAILSLTFTTANSAPVSVPVGTLENPGALLDQGTIGLSGTVVATTENTFTGVGGSTLTGFIRSLVVDTGSGFDFYFQILNTSAGGVNQGNDIFRFVVSGFFPDGSAPADPVSATFRTDGLANLDFTSVGGAPAGWIATERSDKGLGNEKVYSADRDPGVAITGGVGFDFDPSQFINLNTPSGPTTAPQNIEAGERSNWLVIRTSALSFALNQVEIDSGLGTTFSAAFAPIPEPATITLLAAFGLIPAVHSMRRQRRAKHAAQD